MLLEHAAQTPDRPIAEVTAAFGYPDPDEHPAKMTSDKNADKP